MLLTNSHRGKSVCSPVEVSAVFRAILNAEDEASQEREHFWALGLNSKNNVKYIELVSLGTLNASLVHPRELFRCAIINGIAGIVLCHNHPSGDTKPSQEDIAITRRLAQAGEIIGIKIMDHVIIGNGSESQFSFRENGLMGG